MSFTEDDLHNLILGNPAYIEEGMAVVENKPRMNGDEIDLRCRDLDGVDSFVELEWERAGPTAIGQILRYKTLRLEPRRATGELSRYRTILFAPDIDPNDERKLTDVHIEVKRFPKDALTKRLQTHRVARGILNKIHEMLGSTIKVRVDKAPRDAPLIDACYSGATRNDVISGRASYKGLRQPTVGLMFEMTKIMCTSKFSYTNPDQLLRLIRSNFLAPMLFRHRGVEKVISFNNYINRDLHAIGALKEVFSQVTGALEGFLKENEPEGDLLESLAKGIVVKSGSRVALTQAFDYIMRAFEFASSFSDKGISYANNMGLRLLELMLLRGICFANPGPGGATLLQYDYKRKGYRQVVPQSLDFVLDKSYYKEIEI